MSNDQMQTPPAVQVDYPHDIGLDPDFLKIRTHYYAQDSVLEIIPENGDLLTRVTIIREGSQELTGQYRCLTHPSSYFSSPFAWDRTITKQDAVSLISSIRKAKRWDLFRLLMLRKREFEVISDAFNEAGISIQTGKNYYRYIPGIYSTFNAYLADRSASFNRNQRRCLKLASTNGCQFTSEMTLSEIFALYEKRHLKMGEKDYSNTPRFHGFLGTLRRDFMAKDRWVEMGVRTSTGELAAVVLGLWDQKGGLYLFQTVHDPKYASWRLGAILFDRFIEFGIENGCQFLSFVSDSDYLKNFTPFLLETFRIDCFANTLKGSLLRTRRLGVLLKAKSARAFNNSFATRHTSNIQSNI